MTHPKPDIFPLFEIQYFQIYFSGLSNELSQRPLKLIPKEFDKKCLIQLSEGHPFMPQPQQGYMDYAYKRTFSIKKRTTKYDDDDDFYEISF